MTLYYDAAQARIILWQPFDLFQEDHGIVALFFQWLVLFVCMPVRLLNCVRIAPKKQTRTADSAPTLQYGPRGSDSFDSPILNSAARVVRRRKARK